MTQTKEQAQIQLQNALTTTFLANLAFLSEYDNELYHRVDELSRMIENGTYKEKYALDFIMEDGDFDIYDLVNDKYMYDRNPKKRNDEFVRKIELDTKQSIFKIENYFLDRKIYDLDLNNRFSFDMIDASIYSNNQMKEYMKITKDFLDNKKRLKKIDKFIFLGTLLGRHIPRIEEKIDAKMYLVLERNLEIFRLSLFTVDYTILAKKGVIFSIMDDAINEDKKIINFLNISSTENYLIKFSSTGVNIDKYIDSININLLLVNNSLFYTYTRYLYIFVNRTTQYIKDNYKVLYLDDLKKNLSLFENKPVLYIASGPSLDENIEWIKKNQDRFFIVTIGSSLKKLLNNNIRVNLVTTLDEQEILSTLQFDDETIKKVDEDTILLASTITHENILNKFNQKNVFLYEVFEGFYQNNGIVEGVSIGEITLALLLQMNIKSIYLVGLDLALNQETGDTHSKNSNSGSNKIDLSLEQNKEIFDIREGTIKVKGNLKNEVNTLGIYYTSIKAIERLNIKESDTRVYNLSSHGAYLENTIPQKVEDIKIEDFNKVNIDSVKLLSQLEKSSHITLTNKSKEVLIQDLEYIEKILKIELDNILNLQIDSFEEFSRIIIELYIKIELNNKILLLIIKNYLIMLFPYLAYHFNDTKIKQESNKTTKIKKLFVEQIKGLIEDYKICLERVIK